MSATHYKRPYDAQIAPNRNALGSVLAPGASIRDNTVNYLSDKLYNVVAGITVFKQGYHFSKDEISNLKILFHVMEAICEENKKRLS